jgi:hypothetical protein
MPSQALFRAFFWALAFDAVIACAVLVLVNR